MKWKDIALKPIRFWKKTKCCTYVVPKVKNREENPFFLNEKAEEKSSAFVRMTGIEPAHLAASDPKSDVSTSSTTSAF